jgi:hypothetical protein
MTFLWLWVSGATEMEPSAVGLMADMGVSPLGLTGLGVTAI